MAAFLYVIRNVGKNKKCLTLLFYVLYLLYNKDIKERRPYYEHSEIYTEVYIGYTEL